jgi:hypothetical protein
LNTCITWTFILIEQKPAMEHKGDGWSKLRLSALIDLQTQPLEGIFPPSHLKLSVQFQFLRTRQPLCLKLHINYQSRAHASYSFSSPSPLSPPPPIPTYPATGVILLSAFLSHLSIPTPAAGLRAAGGEAEQGTRAAPPSQARRLPAWSRPSSPAAVDLASSQRGVPGARRPRRPRQARGDPRVGRASGQRRRRSTEAARFGVAGGHVHGVAADLQPTGARRPPPPPPVHLSTSGARGGSRRRICFPPIFPLPLRASAPKVGSW